MNRYYEFYAHAIIFISEIKCNIIEKSYYPNNNLFYNISLFIIVLLFK